MEKVPKVSIITPSLNQGQFIERTILSVLNQGYANIEYIVIDGNSADNTLQILKKYEDKLIWRSEPDKGQSDAINKGFRIATGDIVAWINSDDTYKPGAFKTAVEYLRANPEVDIICGDLSIIDENDNIIGEMNGFKIDSRKTYRRLSLGYLSVPQPTVFFRRTISDEIGYLNTNLHWGMDVDFFIRIAARKKFGYLNCLLATHRYHMESKSKSQLSGNCKGFIKDRAAILRKHHPIYFCLFFVRQFMLIPLKLKLFGNVSILGRFRNKPTVGRIEMWEK